MDETKIQTDKQLQKAIHIIMPPPQITTWDRSEIYNKPDKYIHVCNYKKVENLLGHGVKRRLL